MAYTHLDAKELADRQIVQKAVSEVRRELAYLGAQAFGSTPLDPRRGGYEDVDGNWVAFWRAGDPIASKPIGP